MTRQVRWWFSLALSLFLALTVSAATTRNDDSCDISVLPAATLLLPYFEVDLDDPAGETTLVTVTNVSNTDAVARVTLWTDRGYPAFSFNVFLTGYDAYSFNLHDVLGRGQIAPNAPWSSQANRRRGHFSEADPQLAMCEDAEPASVPASAIAALTTGSVSEECEDVGGVHENAVGYATIDVVGNCSTNTPLDPAYWIRDLRNDNILLGDYQQLRVGEGIAEGGPLVHIRAIPGKDFPRTFYARFQDSTSPGRDARQPLPSQFAARWTEGTSLKIWREGRAGTGAPCTAFASDENLTVTDLVTFDDQENAAGKGTARVELAAATKTAVGDEPFPQLGGAENGGWIYLNLDRSQRDDFGSQAWVTSSTRTADRSIAIDAIPLGNGCAAPAEPEARIEPRNGDDSCDIALLPAATLLLPYFEVDTDDRRGEQTIFTITNVSPVDQIARVTLWTDWAFPVITFNVYLTGYDVQTIDLYDVIERGIIAPHAGTGTDITDRGPRSGRNLSIDLGECTQLVGQLPEEYVTRMQTAFMEGVVPGLGTQEGCNNVGLEHDNAVGYATIDVVRNCAENPPTAAEYWTEDIGYDNVLIGDYRQTYVADGLAQGSTLVHIRAIPGVRFPRTFYARFQSGDAPRLDARQPLPSAVAVRSLQGSVYGYDTHYKIWREGITGREGTCATWDENMVTFTETVRFDEAENAWGDLPNDSPYPVYEYIVLPSTSRISANDSSVFPQMDNGAIAGWMYLNLDDPHEDRPWASQAWVITSMRDGLNLSVDVEGAALGNGCSPAAPITEVTVGTEPLGPRP
ncbi:MAG TPA: hypothetical protein VF432_06670 [Thermoanaerobaculia bacterium]